MSLPFASEIEYWQHIATIGEVFVIIGILLEAVELSFTTFDGENKKREHFIVGLSVIILIIGLGLEMQASGNINRMTAKQVAGQQLEIASTNLRAAQAQKDAGAANERAENAGAKIAEAGRQAAAAGQKAAEANERAGALEVEVADRREKAAIAERSLLELKQRIQSRHLIAEQRKVIGEQLASRPKGIVDVACSFGSSESCAFADEIAAVLGQNGWTVPNLAAASAGSVFSGVRIVAESAAMPRATVLQKALKVAGIDAPVLLQASARVDFISIEVGVKP